MISFHGLPVLITIKDSIKKNYTFPLAIKIYFCIPVFELDKVSLSNLP